MAISYFIVYSAKAGRNISKKIWTVYFIRAVQPNFHHWIFVIDMMYNYAKTSNQASCSEDTTKRTVEKCRAESSVRNVSIKYGISRTTLCTHQVLRRKLWKDLIACLLENKKLIYTFNNKVLFGLTRQDF